MKFVTVEYAAPATLLSPGIVAEPSGKILVAALDVSGGGARVLVAEAPIP